VTHRLPVVGSIIDSLDWLEKRLEFLEAEFGRTADEVTRVAIQIEIDVVTEDLGRIRRTRRSAWVLGGRLPHQQD
jgi:hypothetical protein